MTIETPRLRLRPLIEADAADVYAYSSDPRIGPIAGWPPHRSEDESRALIRSVFSGPGIFAMEQRDTGRVVGSLGFVDSHPAGVHPDCPDDEVGYSIAYGCWGRGLVPEAMEAVLAYGFTELGLRRIWCSHYAGNWRSRRVMQKGGFVYQFARPTRVEELGETRQTYFYVLTEERWRGRLSGAL